MAAPGDTVPVSFTVENRGGADPGNFQVQVLLADNNLFDSSAQVLATFTRAQLVAGATGRSFSSPAGFSVTVPAGWASGPADLGLRIVADPAVPEAGLYDKSGVHRGSDWEFLTVVTGQPGRLGRPVRSRCRAVHGDRGHAHEREPGFGLHLHGQQAPWATGS